MRAQLFRQLQALVHKVNSYDDAARSLCQLARKLSYQAEPDYDDRFAKARPGPPEPLHGYSAQSGEAGFPERKLRRHANQQVARYCYDFSVIRSAARARHAVAYLYVADAGAYSYHFACGYIAAPLQRGGWLKPLPDARDGRGYTFTLNTCPDFSQKVYAPSHG
jgi:DNA-binding transcriptional LysR family regulator